MADRLECEQFILARPEPVSSGPRGQACLVDQAPGQGVWGEQTIRLHWTRDCFLAASGKNRAFNDVVFKLFPECFENMELYRSVNVRARARVCV
ncbi:hypothetical protein ElyMa_004729500 [Elysia marginata]|uniref:Uncharacterized protein n=1 Tax=Elysia marginata TaxID=1093978 RepID=A0AAV4ID32_9GAST|nr:hypothetical protein ElyMa_004729500 [Elysia marginata]